MIVVDTSALMAVLLIEPEADECSEILIGQDMLVMSAGTLAEALVVADQRGLGSEMRALVEGLDVEIAAVTKRVAEIVSEAYMRWDEGVHPAGLNIGDCHVLRHADYWFDPSTHFRPWRVRSQTHRKYRGHP